jgi:hypothetical protein
MSLRPEEVKPAGRAFFAWLKRQGWPEGFQVLCHNCNSSKGYYGYCPHEKEREN